MLVVGRGFENTEILKPTAIMGGAPFSVVSSVSLHLPGLENLLEEGQKIFSTTQSPMENFSDQSYRILYTLNKLLFQFICAVVLEAFSRLLAGVLSLLFEKNAILLLISGRSLSFPAHPCHVRSYQCDFYLSHTQRGAVVIKVL